MAETKRRVLTPEERIAKLEQDLAEAKRKANEKAAKRATQLGEQRAKLVERAEEIARKIQAIDTELHSLGAVPLEFDDDEGFTPQVVEG